jgi:cell division transport system ATP-binding protein
MSGLRYGTGAETLSDLSFSLRKAVLLPDRSFGRGQDIAAQAPLLAQRPSRGLIRLSARISSPCAQAAARLSRRIGVVFQDSGSSDT